MRKFLVLVTATGMLVRGSLALAGSEQAGASAHRRSARRFTLDQAIITALQQNPDILRSKQEIERTKGVVLEIGAQSLPHVSPSAALTWTDPKLVGSSFSSATGGTGLTGGGTGGEVSGTGTSQTDTAYAIRITGTQLIFNYSTFRSIRGTFFQRDSAYFAFRNSVDQVIATVKTQFYQVILNRALITVQEEAVHLLESQLKDQQNRFEAGTVPRFNVLQAEVALSNQIPNLISARNAYRIAKIILAKTLGLDFQPRRGENPPLEVVGEMPYIPRTINLADAIELGKERRPFLKQARANVLNQIEQVRATAGQWLPTITTTGGGEWASSPTNS